jgi:hypothetical protein
MLAAAEATTEEANGVGAAGSADVLHGALQHCHCCCHCRCCWTLWWIQYMHTVRMRWNYHNVQQNICL